MLRTRNQVRANEIDTRTTAIIPASATKASSNDIKMREVRLVKPRGETKRLIGSSFRTDSNTRPAPAKRLGAIIGKSIFLNLRRGDAPRVIAASCNCLGTAITATRQTPKANAPNRTT